MAKWKCFCSQVLVALASLKLTLAIIPILILLSLSGAWIPQRNSVSDGEILKRFGSDGSELLLVTGLSNVFQSPIFLAAIALLFVNLACCTFVTMAPRLRERFQGSDFLSADIIRELVLNRTLSLRSVEQFEDIRAELKRLGFRTIEKGEQMVAQKGKLGWLAAPITHLGLFVLLTGAIVSSLTSYGGVLNLRPGESAGFTLDKTAKPMLGEVPSWTVALQSTSQDQYANGKPKQWYSSIAIVKDGSQIAEGTVSVNNPLSFNNVSFYQSDWAIEAVRLNLAGEPVVIPVKDMGPEMGGRHMGVFPLLPGLLMIVAVEKWDGPVKIFFKDDKSDNPKLMTKLSEGQRAAVGKLIIEYDGTLVRSGLQYKCDPGQPIVYLSFALLFLGAIFVATPSVRLFIARCDADSRRLVIGCNPGKFKALAIRDLNRIEECVAKTNSIEVVAIES